MMLLMLTTGTLHALAEEAPIGLWPEVEFAGEKVDDMHGKTLFVYTDGINEAESIHQDVYQNEVAASVKASMIAVGRLF